MAGRSGDRHRPGRPDLSEWLERFPPRKVPASWEATRVSRGQVLARLLEPPFSFDSVDYQACVRRGLVRVLEWLRVQPGTTWQERWMTSRAEDEHDWRLLPFRSAGLLSQDGDPNVNKINECSAGLTALICADVMRPSLEWLLVTPAPKNLPEAMARTRDQAAFAELAGVCDASAIGCKSRQVALARVAMIMAAKGGLVKDITVGDCIEMQQTSVDVFERAGRGKEFRSPFFYQLLRSLGGFPETAPATTRVFNVRGQMSVEAMIDRYGIECKPVRDLLVDYLREFVVSSDYSTVKGLALVLGKLFWRDLELHHPGIASLQLPADVASAWKQRMRTKTTRTVTAGGEVTETPSPRVSAVTYLGTVRSFYLDIAQWAADDPGRWGPWVAVCPIRDGELNRKKEATRRKSRMDQRTRERLPVLPALVAATETERTATAQLLAAARAASPGEEFTAAARTLRRPVLAKGAAKKIWADDPVTGKRRDLEAEDRRAFWAWAAVEVLGLTGIRIEELCELSHHSLIQYRLPTTRELVPLLQIVPSKTDTERLLVISPELADVLSTIIMRIRNDDGGVPLVASYDHHEQVWNPPMPLLFQWRSGLEDRPLEPNNIRWLLNRALTNTGLTDISGAPLRFTPHDFRRIFLTDAVMHGMPPHIAQLVAGHRDINTTMGYKAAYPEEVIHGHRAFIARRRRLRPCEEYRIPTDEEWDEFLGHFERRRVALGDCGRAWSTPCIHEHSCLRCPLLRPSPTQRARVREIHDNLLARIAEAEREGWAGEVEGLEISLAGAKQKLAQLDEMDRRATTVHLGAPAFSEVAGRTTTTTAKEASS